MRGPLTRPELIKAIAREIDSDEPPGLAANVLAAAVLDLVENRGGKEAAILLEDVRKLGDSHPRPIGQGRRR